MGLLRTYAGRRAGLAEWLTDYQPNLDKNLRLEYLAGEALDRYDEVAIYDRMTATLQYPDGFFRINKDAERELRQIFLNRYGAPDR